MYGWCTTYRYVPRAEEGQLTIVYVWSQRTDRQTNRQTDMNGDQRPQAAFAAYIFALRPAILAAFSLATKLLAVLGELRPLLPFKGVSPQGASSRERERERERESLCHNGPAARCLPFLPFSRFGNSLLCLTTAAACSPLAVHPKLLLLPRHAVSLIFSSQSRGLQPSNSPSIYS
jgi:hypothetical protein